MTTTPLISIIVPVYNVADYLAKALDSLLAQTHRNLQIICVNDGATDGSGNILAEYAERDSRVDIIHQTNTGISGARSTGMKQVRGEYVAFLDADDWFDVDTCEKALRLAKQHQADIVMWSYTKEYANSSQKVTPIRELTQYEGETLQKLHCRLIGLRGHELAHPEHLDSLGPVWAKLYRAELLRQANVSFVALKEIGTAEDILFNIELFAYAKKAVYTPNITYHYRRNVTTSITKRYAKQLTEQHRKLFDYMQKCVDSLAYRDMAQEALNNRTALSVIMLGLNIMRCPDRRERYNALSRFLEIPWYRTAVQKLPLKHFPVHWRLFFACCKHRITPGVFMLLSAICAILQRQQNK